jgi:RsiW-degrading membrane proteinase PrsW (M82 family)
MLSYGTNKITIFYFIITSVILKILPIYYLRNETIQIKDIVFTVFLFILFSLWLKINNQTVVSNFNMIRDSLLQGKNNTPLIAIMKKVRELIEI